MKSGIILIGMGGHSFVVTEAILQCKKNIVGYMDQHKKNINPFSLVYLGSEQNNLLFEELRANTFHLSIGDNSLRKKIALQLNNHEISFSSVIHPSSIVASNAIIGFGSFCSANSVIQPLAQIGHHCIINTGAIIEHECVIGDFSHIAPGAVLCGNVQIGEGTLVGARTVIRPGIHIGKNCVIGAGSVVVKDIPDNSMVYGNPAK